MNSPSAERNPVECLAEEFAQRCRRGESPSLEEYAARHPELAEEIRELFPALLVMERLKPAAADLTLDEGGPDAAGVEAIGPRRLGDYRILREVGRGGMGVVYEAVQESLGRHVALKVLPGHGLSEPTYLERFRREAKAAARLHHTNIVPVFGTGVCDGVHFYAMQFIPGQGLDRVLDDLRQLRHGHDVPPAGRDCSAARGLCTGTFAPAPPASGTEVVPEPNSAEELSETHSGLRTTHGVYFQSVARMGVQVADALAHAHKQGVLHRDIKPSNLLLDPQGTVWVTDFGLAKSDDGGGLTNTGDIVGTLRYMAPERFDGQSVPQGDLYSLGLTLYELLTLRPAFDDANRGRLVERVLREPPVPPRRIDRRVPRDLETIVLKSLTKNPRERYARAEDLADDLRRFLADQPIRARRSPWHERAWRWCRRNPAVAALSTLVGLLLVALSVGSLVAAFHFQKQRNVAIEKGAEARAAKEKAAHYQQKLEEYLSVQPDPGSLSAYRGKVGKTYRFRVVGNVMGSVWGTDVYTDDSSLATAALHAGVLQPGEQAVVRVTILPGQQRYRGSVRNGVMSSNWGPFAGSIRIEPLSGQGITRTQPAILPAPPATTRLVGPEPGVALGLFGYRGQVGRTLYFRVTGDTMGWVWGTNVYTDDSSLGTAAVHAGILRPGQTGVVKVTILPGRDAYEGSTRNGVTSLPYPPWQGSYRIEPASKRD